MDYSNNFGTGLSSGCSVYTPYKRKTLDVSPTVNQVVEHMNAFFSEIDESTKDYELTVGPQFAEMFVNALSVCTIPEMKKVTFTLQEAFDEEAIKVDSKADGEIMASSGDDGSSGGEDYLKKFKKFTLNNYKFSSSYSETTNELTIGVYLNKVQMLGISEKTKNRIEVLGKYLTDLKNYMYEAQKNNQSVKYYQMENNYIVYLLHHTEKNITYVGMTNNKNRRIRQHNGILVGGARYTTNNKGDGEWKYYGWLSIAENNMSKNIALSIEKKIKLRTRKMRGQTSIERRIKAIDNVIEEFNSKQLDNNLLQFNINDE